VATVDADAVHNQVARGEITPEEAIDILLRHAWKLDAELG
jgi:hypothetical protein